MVLSALADEGYIRRLPDIIDTSTLDRQGILTGPHNAYLLGFLTQDGYQTR